MNRFFFFLLLNIITVSVIYAQDGQSEDVLYLKDGAVKYGQIVEYKVGEYVLFLDRDTEVVDTVTSNQIFKMTQLSALGNEKRGRDRKNKIYEFEEEGRFHAVSFAFSCRREQNEPQPGDFFVTRRPTITTGFNMQYIYGHQFNRMLGVGLGGSFDFYNLSTGESLFTLFGHYRGYLTRSIVAPFISINAGYGIASKNKEHHIIDSSGGWMFHPELGCRLGASAKSNFLVSMGYRFQEASFVREFPFNGSVEFKDVTYRRLLFSLSLLF